MLFRCARAAELQAGTDSPEQRTLVGRPEVPRESTYVIGPGDVLHLMVWQEPQFNQVVVVRPDGRISLPLLSDLPVSGLTPDQAQVMIAKRLQGLVRHPRVTIMVAEIHSRIVYIMGEVQHPGAYPLIVSMNVVQLIAHAGGPTEYARKKSVYVLPPEGGRKIRVNYEKVLEGQDLEQNVQLVPGDTVVVP